MDDVPINTESSALESLKLSDPFLIDISELKDNPLNYLFGYDDKEFNVLIKDIKNGGIIHPIIINMENVIICGHKRKTVALILGIKSVPAQRIISPITEEIESELFFKDNIIRRQLKYKDKKEIIRKLYLPEILEDHRGGFVKNQGFSSRRSTDLFITLPKRIEKSIGIPEGTAKRILANLRKEENGFKNSESTLKKFNKHFSSIKKLTLAEGKDFRKIVRMEIHGFLKQL